ncbi:hypothetical protein C7S13_6205 [Burkholderia cepacia]|nr:hypothetical protein [Burkholderia cepacia]QOH37180.1 hypothetical protein C7S14_0338 [Burkholderia cepacia]
MWSVSRGSSPGRRDGISILTAPDVRRRRRVIPMRHPCRCLRHQQGYLCICITGVAILSGRLNRRRARRGGE